MNLDPDLIFFLIYTAALLAGAAFLKATGRKA